MYGDEEYPLSGDALASRYDDVGRVDKTLLRIPQGAEFELKSEDSAAREVGGGHYPVEFLNSLDISYLPPNTIRIKVGWQALLLMILNAEHGMRNGRNAILRRIHPW